MYCLMMWVWLKSDSISMFARESLKTFCNASKDVLYEAMNREDGFGLPFMGSIKENLPEHISAVPDGSHHLRDGLGNLSFLPNDHLSGQYQPPHPVMGVSHLAHPGKVQQPLAGRKK